MNYKCPRCGKKVLINNDMIQVQCPNGCGFWTIEVMFWPNKEKE